MKNILLFSLLLFVANVTVAQNYPVNEVPYIEVTGSADIEVDPDEIRLSITIGSYKKSKAEQTVKLEEVDKTLMDILSKAGVAKKDIILKSATTQGYWSYWWRYGVDDDSRLTKQYEVIFTDFSQLNDLLEQFPGPKEGFVNVNISSLKNKKITEYRKQTKIEAIKAAKDKAQYLLESVGNSPGKLIQVIELDEDDWGWYRPAAMNSNVISQSSLSVNNNSGDDSPSMQKIKLRYRIKARFEIK